MKFLLLMCLLLYSSIHTAQTGIFSQSETEGRDVSLSCVNEGKVIWEKGTDGGKSAILSAENGEITQKHRPDPENRYSVLTDSSLVIKNLNLSDSGIYYCNAAPVVNLTVNPAPPAGIFSQSETEGRGVRLSCVNEGKVIWSKGTDGGKSAILSAENGEITQKHRPDPENRYSVLGDSSLVIKNLNLSDSGIYYCNSAPVVNLTVNPPAGKRDTYEENHPNNKGLWVALVVVGGAVLLLALASLSIKKFFSKRKEDSEMPHYDVYTAIEYVTFDKA